jgi:hypothetical protein
MVQLPFGQSTAQVVFDAQLTEQPPPGQEKLHVWPAPSQVKPQPPLLSASQRLVHDAEQEHADPVHASLSFAVTLESEQASAQAPTNTVDRTTLSHRNFIESPHPARVNDDLGARHVPTRSPRCAALSARETVVPLALQAKACALGAP